MSEIHQNFSEVVKAIASHIEYCLRNARELGNLGITQTKQGHVRLTYDRQSQQYKLVKQGTVKTDPCTLFEGKKSEMAIALSQILVVEEEG